MRELITEATRSVEDSQTAQALHGLLSLKSPSDCVLTANSSASVVNLSSTLIQQAAAAVGIAVANTSRQNSTIHTLSSQSLSNVVTQSSPVTSHTALRAAIMSSSAPGTLTTGSTAGSAVQILLHMKHENSIASEVRGCNLSRSKLIKPKEAQPLLLTNNVIQTVTSPVASPNRTRLPVLLGKQNTSTTAVSNVQRLPKGIVNSVNPIPIQLLATSQGMVAIQHPGYQVVQQSSSGATTLTVVAPSSMAKTTHGTVAKAQQQQAAKPVQLLIAKATTPAMSVKAEVAESPSKRIKLSQDGNTSNTSIIAAVSDSGDDQSSSLDIRLSTCDSTDNDATLDSEISNDDLSHVALLTAVRESYEKLFWKVSLHAVALRNAHDLTACESNGSAEVKLCTPSRLLCNSGRFLFVKLRRLY